MRCNSSHLNPSDHVEDWPGTRPGAPARSREFASRGAFRLFLRAAFLYITRSVRGKSTDREEGAAVTYVIAEPCIDVLDRAGVEECPVDCICEGARALYIHPADCGACEPVSRSKRSSTRTTSRASGRHSPTTTPGSSPTPCPGATSRAPPRLGDQDRPARSGHRPGRHPSIVEHMTDQSGYKKAMTESIKPGHLDDAPTDPTTSKPRRRLLKLLRRSDTPLDVYQIADTTGLHITTVRFHLDVLAKAGQVTVQKTPRSHPGTTPHRLRRPHRGGSSRRVPAARCPARSSSRPHPTHPPTTS